MALIRQRFFKGSMQAKSKKRMHTPQGYTLYDTFDTKNIKPPKLMNMKMSESSSLK